MMQINDPQNEQQTIPLFRLGFRPFFLGGTAFSVFSLLIWLLVLHGYISFLPLGGAYWWHIHEMIFGFGCAIIAGFLLTAVQTWTGIKGIQGNLLFGLFLLWLAGRVVLLFPFLLGDLTSSLIDLSFLPITAYVLGRPIVKIKQYRNLFFIPLLALFTIANVEMYLSLSQPENVALTYSGYAAVLLISFLMSVMSGRVTPMFTANGTKTPKVSTLVWLDITANASLAIGMLMMLLHPFFTVKLPVFGIVLLCAGILQSIRWLRWRPWVTLGVPLLWSLHMALLFICLGLISLGVSYLSTSVPSNNAWHILTIGGMGGLMLAMISRVSLGHTGRTLTAPTLMPLAFSCISIAAICRAIGPWIYPQHTLVFIDISAFFWIMGFGIFVIKYGPMLSKVRIDNKPG